MIGLIGDLHIKGKNSSIAQIHGRLCGSGLFQKQRVNRSLKIMCPLMRNSSLLNLEKEGATGYFGVSAPTNNPCQVDIIELCRNDIQRMCVLFFNKVPYSNAMYYIYVCMGEC